MQDEPGTLNRVTRVEGSSIEVIEDRASCTHYLEQRAKLRLEELAFNFRDRPINPFRAGAAAGDDLAEVRAQFLRGGDGDHQRREPAHRPRFRIRFWRHDARCETVM